jgi:WD40 repeat protein
MKKFIKLTNLFLLFLAGYYPNRTLAMKSQVNPAININPDSIAEGLISGDASTFKLIEDSCQTSESRQEFINNVLPDFFIMEKYHKVNTRAGCSLRWKQGKAMVASRSYDKKVQAWDMATGECKIFSGQEPCCKSIEWSFDETMIASVTTSAPCIYAIEIWDVKKGEHRKLVPKYRDYISDVAWHPDNKKIACCSTAGRVEIWDIATNYHTILTEREHKVRSIAWSPDGTKIAGGTDDGKLKIWDITTTELTDLSISGDTYGIYQVAWSPDGTKIAAGSTGGPIYIWNISTKSKIAKLSIGCGYGHEFSPMAWSFDSKKIVGTLSNNYDHGIFIWNVETGKYSLFGQNASTTPLNAIGLSPDGNHLVTASQIVIHIGAKTKTKDAVVTWRKITDLNQALLILVLKYLKKNNRSEEFYKIVNLPYLNREGELVQFVLAWFDFYPVEQRYLKQTFYIWE